MVDDRLPRVPVCADRSGQRPADDLPEIRSYISLNTNHHALTRATMRG